MEKVLRRRRNNPSYSKR